MSLNSDLYILLKRIHYPIPCRLFVISPFKDVLFTHKLLTNYPLLSPPLISYSVFCINRFYFGTLCKKIKSKQQQCHFTAHADHLPSSATHLITHTCLPQRASTLASTVYFSISHTLICGGPPQYQRWVFHSWSCASCSHSLRTAHPSENSMMLYTPIQWMVVWLLVRW